MTLWSQGGFVGQAGNADIAYDIFTYLGMVQDFAIGIADALTAGAYSKGLNALGLSWAVDTSSEAYRYGTYTGQALVLVAAVLQPELGVALGLLQVAGCLANVAQALQQGNYGQAAGWAAAALVALVPYISACKVGTAVGKVLAQAAGETVGAVAAQGANLLTRGIGLYGAVTSTVTAIEQFRNGDIVGGLLSLGNAALDLYSATRSCFTAEMLLDTADGKKRADTIELGDRLWSRNENDPTGPCELKEVEAVFVREAPVWNVHVAGQLIRTTAEHPFWVLGRGWIAACGLRIGDLVSTRDGQLVPVEGVADSGAVETVYNWRVADFHTYFVGDSSWGFSVWAHNSCYEVGTANNLRKTPQKGTQVNHAPQSREAELLVGNWRGANRAGNEPAIRLPRSEHEAVTAAQAARSAPASARDLLASDIRILRNNTNAPNSALLELIEMNRRLHPTDYLPLHR